jgi:cell division protein ZapE
MNLRQRYFDALDRHGYTPDDAQLTAIATLERVREDLLHESRRPGVAARLRRRLPRILGSGSDPEPTRGAYLWGGVGRGKTFVMDLFYDSLPFEQKLRQHFHRMMYHVHGQLKNLSDRRDPLETVADDLARRARVICFDEFFVADIADAMILGRLLDALFARGVSLVATSNIAPDELYRDGLQRQRFLPAIDLLKTHTEVQQVAGSTDYRLRVLEQAEIYHAPLDAEATRNLEAYFDDIAPETGTRGQPMDVHGRDIVTIRRADGIAWFDFGALCDGPRSQDDYIEIARSFQAVLLSDVPIMDRQKEDQARRFIALVDEFYDRRVKLIISAAAPIADIYAGTRLGDAFERTRSRLLEMQSTTYLAAPHVP